MKKGIFKMITLAVGAAILVSTFSACSGSSSSSGTSAAASSSGQLEGSLKGVTIKIGTSGLFGPFSYYDKDGKTLIGYDLDLIKELQNVLGFTIADNNIQAMSYSALTTSVAEGKLDMAAAALCVTDERKQVMNFSNTYYDAGQVVMVNTGHDEGITSVNDLAGKVVAVEKGTASHAYATKFLTKSTIQVHDTITTAYESLEQQKVDAVIQDGPGAAFYIKTTNGTKLKAVGDQFNKGQSPYAIAFNKNFKYVNQFNAALKKLTENGTMAKLESKWCK